MKFYYNTFFCTTVEEETVLCESQSKELVCVQLDESIYNTFVLRYSGTEFNIGFPFASGESSTSSSAPTVEGGS